MWNGENRDKILTFHYLNISNSYSYSIFNKSFCLLLELRCFQTRGIFFSSLYKLMIIYLMFVRNNYFMCKTLLPYLQKKKKYMAKNKY